MFDAALKALGQIFTAPFRSVLLKSIGLAIAFLIVLGILLDRLLVWLTGAGGQWIEGTLGSLAHWPVVALGWLLAIGLGFGLFFGAIFLMPAVTSLVASFFADEIAEHVEREHYPADPPGVALPFARAAIEGVRSRCWRWSSISSRCRSCCLRVLAPSSSFSRRAYLLGREYFELAAMRFHPVEKPRRCGAPTAARYSSPACSSRLSCRSRSSIWRRRCSASPSWSTCTSGLPAARAGSCWSRRPKARSHPAEAGLRVASISPPAALRWRWSQCARRAETAARFFPATCTLR